MKLSIEGRKGIMPKKTLGIKTKKKKKKTTRRKKSKQRDPLDLSQYLGG